LRLLGEIVGQLMRDTRHFQIVSFVSTSRV
jgi:hypothetical protein